MRRAALLILPLLVVLGMTKPQALVRAQDAPTLTDSPSAPAGDTPTPQPVLPALAINYPAQGEVLRGQVPVTGAITISGFTGWELAFSYADDTTDTWFLLAKGSDPLTGELATWDTTGLVDGNYSLRLRVRSSDAYQDVLVRGLRVANYTVFTATPSPTQSPTGTLMPTETLTPLPTFTAIATQAPTITPTFTRLPPNPLTIGPGTILFNLTQGIALVFVLFAFFGAILWLRRPRRS